MKIFGNKIPTNSSANHSCKLQLLTSNHDFCATIDSCYNVINAHAKRKRSINYESILSDKLNKTITNTLESKINGKYKSNLKYVFLSCLLKDLGIGENEMENHLFAYLFLLKIIYTLLDFRAPLVHVPPERNNRLLSILTTWKARSRALIRLSIDTRNLYKTNCH